MRTQRVPSSLNNKSVLSLITQIVALGETLQIELDVPPVVASASLRTPFALVNHCEIEGSKGGKEKPRHIRNTRITGKGRPWENLLNIPSLVAFQHMRSLVSQYHRFTFTDKHD